jgi:hypothetical protein
LNYGELRGGALESATEFGFGLSSASIPTSVIISAAWVDECFEGFQTTLASEALEFRRFHSGFLVRNDQKSALFCKGGTGESSFTDLTYVLCRCTKVEEMLFVGTGEE